MAGRGR